MMRQLERTDYLIRAGKVQTEPKKIADRSQKQLYPQFCSTDFAQVNTLFHECFKTREKIVNRCKNLLLATADLEACPSVGYL